MKVFVTGADGMLGSSVTRELLQQGYEVRAMSFPGRKTNTLDALPVEIVSGDILDKSFLEREIKNCDAVIHIAALTNVWPRRSSKVKSVNIEGTKHVMDLVEKYGLQRLVHIGSASSFTHGTKENPGDERNGFSGWKFGMDYLDSKYMAQEMLLERYKENGLPVVVICPTFMIGPYDSGPSSGQMLLGLYNDSIPGYSGGGKNFVCSFDVASAVVNALKRGKTGECYIAGNENLSFKEFFMKASAIMGKKFKLRRVPSSLILAAGFFNSTKARLTGTAPKLSYGMARMASINQYFSSQKAVDELQMPQTPIEKGIEQCMDWFKKNDYLK